MEELLSTPVSRRSLIRSGAAAAALLAIGVDPLEVLAASAPVRITILHTNDVHSRIEPFPMDGSANQGLGGVARRAALIRKIRSEEKNVLLLDAGDIFQGTPYFNLFGGELEMKLMSEMGYDAATMGNHDFDNGLEGFAKQLPHARFPILVANYDFTGTLLRDRTLPYTVFKRDGIRIGVFGLGIELKGLVDQKNYGQTVYLDPIQKAIETAAILRDRHRCHLVICLSHLGYRYEDDKVSDRVLAAQTRGIDLIIGGHTHTFMPQPEDVPNLDGHPTTINQVGWAGINLGRIDYTFHRGRMGENRPAVAYTIGAPQRLT
ncbi:MAG TPA: metallophosphatase [Puia sp.]|uniref:bifunctional metallophosphatase/5'-nucleotidase n=1 Tax=Puia sp. TaxID=2045100 RepID=UPI002C02C3AE|nr:metallophosphatase [Puia sp.]HVU94688.1 metallophosphatase [Puia sp.]